MQDPETVVSETEATGVVGFRPENPFVRDGAGWAGIPTGTPAAARTFKPGYDMQSPFASEYEGDDSVPGPRAELYADVLSELEDEDFEEAVTDLVNEAAALAEERFSYEAGDAAQERIEAERGLRDYFEPLARECEALVDSVAESVRTTDLTTMSEDELEAFLDRFAPGETTLPPTQDTFLNEFFLGKVKNLVKKGRALAHKLSPSHIVLDKLKALVRPLLERVLRMALDKLPVSVRPIARQLATKFLGVKAEQEMEADGEDVGETAAADPAAIAQELDAKLAGYMVEGEDFERHVAIEQFAAEQNAAASDTLRELQQRRAEFARDITELASGEDAGPVVERFVPAILAALKLGIKIIGRPKVVNFLAGLVAKLIAKYVGKEQSVALSRALVDTGLQLVSLEAPAEPDREAGYALASTLEDTIARVTQEAPSTAWEDEEVLEGYVREAFGKAASAHFPDSEIRSDLHEASQVSGAWVPLPAANKRKHYKKYSRVLDVALTSQMAAALKSFGGLPVQAVLRDQLGLSPNGPIPVRVHLYEAVPGATLPDIAMHEKNVRGLGTSRREAWSLIHPLTPEAAGILLKEPGLGRQVDAKFLADRNVVTVGQRFYYLETPQARPRTITGPRGRSRAPRVAQTKVRFDFPKGELRVLLFYSEAQAQALATQLRARAPGGVVIAALKAGLESRLASMFSGAPTRALRIIHEAVPVEQFHSPVIGGALKLVGRPLATLTLKWVLEAFKRELDQRRDQFAAQFARAAASEADGVSVVIVFQRPSSFQQLRRVFSGNSPLPVAGLGAVLTRQAMSDYTVTIHPGYPGPTRLMRPVVAARPSTTAPSAGSVRSAASTRPVASAQASGAAKPARSGR